MSEFNDSLQQETETVVVVEVAPALAGAGSAPTDGGAAVLAATQQKCRAIVEALADVRPLMGSDDPAFALTSRGTKDVTLYAATDGWLHVFHGPVDPTVPVDSHRAVDPRFPTGCRYHAVPVTSEATFEYAFQANARPLESVGPTTDPYTDLVRTWTFRIGGETLELSLADSDPSPERVEYERFVAALTEQILLAGPPGAPA
jgi:hypothetical protein